MGRQSMGELTQDTLNKYPADTPSVTKSSQFSLSVVVPFRGELTFPTKENFVLFDIPNFLFVLCALNTFSSHSAGGPSATFANEISPSTGSLFCCHATKMFIF